MFKRLAIILICLIMVFVAVFSFVVGVVAVPTIYSYAEVIDDDPIYVPLKDPSDLVQSFQSYCKSRDLTIEGSIADAVTTFTTGAFNSACNTIGIDISQLQSEIKAEYDQSGKPVKFLYNSTGINAMNRIFAQFLQDNELEVGDDDVNMNVFDGYFYADNDGNTCLVWDIKDTVLAPGQPLTNISQYVNKRGTNYIYTRDELVNYINLNSANNTRKNLPTMHIGNNDYTMRLWLQKSDVATSVMFNPSGSTTRGTIYYLDEGVQTRKDGYPILYVVNGASGTLHLGTYIERSNGNFEIYNYAEVTSTLSNNDLTNIYIISTQINNNTYEGDTYITNEGDVIQEPDPVVPGGNDPGWNIGGGEGQATDGNGNTWNITFPDFELPDLNIDWSIQGLGEKFPFSIPFDLVALVNVLNAEPEAPRFEGTVNFGFTTWDYDINLEQFDSVASACRIAELLLLVFGLILITRSIIKG